MRIAHMLSTGVATILLAQALFAQTPHKPTEGDLLGAQSLRRDALSMLYAPADTTARASRLIALSQMAYRLDSSDPATNRLLSGIYQSQGRLEDLKAALDICHQADPDDYVLGSQWLQLTLDLMSTAQDKIDFITDFVKRQDISPHLRADAAVALAQTYRGQASKSLAKSALEQAVKLNPNHPTAAFSLLETRENTTADERLSALLAVLTGQPRRVDQAISAGIGFADLGLHEEAMVFIEHAWALAKDARSTEIIRSLGLQYASILLDMDKPSEAMEILEYTLRNDPRNPDLLSLQIETYQALGEYDRAATAVTELEGILTSSQTAGSPAYARDLAWYYLLAQPRPERALAYIQSAAAVAGDDPVIIRILGIAELETTHAESGERRLKPIVSQDPFAAWFLARRYYRLGKSDEARDVLLKGLNAGRTGPGYRRLKSLAEENGVEIPPIEHAQKGKTLAQNFDQRAIMMCHTPGDYLSVTIKPVRERVGIGDPLQVEVTLKNISDIRVPLGVYGLINPQAAFVATVSDHEKAIANLPMAQWPAPAMLEPEQSITTTVRLDIGTLGDILVKRPFEDFLVVIAVVTDPTYREGRILSRVSHLKTKPIVVTRTNLLQKPQTDDPEQWRQAYNQYVGHLSWYAQYGKVNDKMRSARQIAALLDHQRRIAAARPGTTRVPRAAISRPVLLRLMVELLNSPSDVVRAEMLAAQVRMDTDSTILRLLGEHVEDPSPLVRMRLAELMGLTGSQQTVMDYLVQDKDNDVRRMAGALRSTRR